MSLNFDFSIKIYIVTWFVVEQRKFCGLKISSYFYNTHIFE